MEGEDSDRPLDTLLDKQSLQSHPQHIIYGYCLKPGYLQHNFWKAYELHFVRGSKDQLKSNSPFKKAENTAPNRSTHLVPLLGENPGPIGIGTTLHP